MFSYALGMGMLLFGSFAQGAQADGYPSYYFKFADLEPPKYVFFPYEFGVGVDQVKEIVVHARKNSVTIQKLFVTFEDGEKIPLAKLEGKLYSGQRKTYRVAEQNGRRLEAIEFEATSSPFGDDARLAIVLGVID